MRTLFLVTLLPFSLFFAVAAQDTSEFDTTVSNTISETSAVSADSSGIKPDSTVIPANDILSETDTGNVQEKSVQLQDNRSSDKSITPVSESSSAPDNSAILLSGKKAAIGGRSGIGFNLMVRLYFPEQINDFMDDLKQHWVDSLDGFVSVNGDYHVFTSLGLKCKGIIYAAPVFAIEPFAMVQYKFVGMLVTNRDNSNVWTNLCDIGGGVNCWLRFSPQKRFSFKTGVGPYLSYSIISVSGFLGDTKLTGTGYGVNCLAGFDITFKKVALNIDFCVPVGSATLVRDGGLDVRTSGGYYDNDYTPMRYPKKIRQTGFIFSPGVTFHF